MAGEPAPASYWAARAREETAAGHSGRGFAILTGNCGFAEGTPRAECPFTEQEPNLREAYLFMWDLCADLAAEKAARAEAAAAILERAFQN